MKKFPFRVTIWCLMLVAVLFFFAKSPGKMYRTQIFDKLDTVSEITIITQKNGTEVLNACNALLTEADKRYSHTKPESDIFRINNAPAGEAVRIHPKTIKLLEDALLATEKTDGLFDITVGAVSELWGFGSEQEQIPDAQALETAQQTIGMNLLTIDSENATVTKHSEGQKLTLGAIAKGAITEELIALLQEQNISSALINLGGNTYALGKKTKNEPWTVAILDPENPDLFIGTLSVENQAVITSGDYQRFFEQNGVRYHHILNPKTGMPSESGLSSVTIVGKNATEADILSTACFVLGYEKSLPLLAEYGAYAVFVTKDHQVFYSPELSAQFTFDNPNYSYEIIP